jgi:hypothetical protein
MIVSPNKLVILSKAPHGGANSKDLRLLFEH